MKHLSKQCLAAAAALSMSLLQTAAVTPLTAAAREPGAVSVQTETVPRTAASESVSARRVTQIEDGRQYILAGGSASLDQILTPELTSGSKVSSVFKAVSLSGLNLSDADNEISAQADWIWKAHLGDNGTIALEHAASGKFMSMTEGERPIALTDEPVYVNLVGAAHSKAGRSFSLNLGTWYMNYSETQFGFSFYDGTKYGQDENDVVNQLVFYEVSQTETPDPDPEPDPDPDQPIDQDALANVLFLSDFQTGNEVAPYTSKNDVPESLRSVFRGIGQKMTDAGFTDIDSALYCGDYSAFSGQYNYDADPTYGIEALTDEVNGIFGSDHSTVAIQGNHDLTNYPYSSGPVEFDDYVVYAINTMYQADTAGSFPWYQGSSSANKARVERLSQNLDAYLDTMQENGDRRPVIIMSHVPLHFSGRVSSLYGAGDNMNAGLLFDVINEHGADQDIVFLFGHNHSNGWDSYLGGSTVFRQPGDALAIPDADKKSGNTTNYYKTEELTFTYMNAGYVGYWKHGTADNTLTATMCQIYPDRMVFRRYSSEGLHPMGSAGQYNDKYADQGILNGFEIVTEETISPATVLRNTGEPVLSIQTETAHPGSVTVLHALTKNLVRPEVTWQISDPAAFEIRSQGKDLTLYCLKAGDYSVNVTAVDEQGNTLTSETTLHVEATEAEPALKLTDGSGQPVTSLSLDKEDTAELHLEAEGISDLGTVSWSVPGFASAQGSDTLKTVSFQKTGKGTLEVSASATDAHGNPVALHVSCQLEAVSLPNYARTSFNNEEITVMLVNHGGFAVSSELKTVNSVSVLSPSAALSGIALNDENDTIKGNWDDLLWTLSPAENGKWTVRHQQSGKYLTLNASSRGVSLSDEPCVLSIETGTAAGGDMCIAIRNGSMYLNHSSSRSGFCGYSGETITQPNNQYMLYTRIPDEPDVPVDPETVDLTLLRQAVAYAHSLEIPETLHETIRAYFEEALAEAEAILENGCSTQEEADAAWEKLCDAVHYLEFTSDKTPLLALIEQAKSLNEKDYDKDSWKALQEALQQAEDTAADPNALDERIQAACDALRAALAGLNPSQTLDTRLLELVIQASEALDLDQYTDEGKDTFLQALQDARAVLADPADQAAVDEAAMRLNDAYLALRLAPSEAMLEELRSFASYLAELDTADFPLFLNVSIETFQNRLHSALDNPSLTRDEALSLLRDKENLQKQIDEALQNKPEVPVLPEKPEDKKPAVPGNVSGSEQTVQPAQKPAAESRTPITAETPSSVNRSVRTASSLQTGWFILAASGAAALAAALKRRNQ